MPESRERTDKGREPQTDANAQQDASAVAAAGAEELDERITLALDAADEKKAHDLVVLDLREVASFTDYFIIASGTNVRQVQAVADEVQEQLRKRLGVKPARVEGYNSAEWILLDYGDFIFHVFEEKSRRFYDLERLWRDAVRVRLTSEPTTGSEGGGASRDAR
jgi:ribosome-associated protein